MKQVSILFAAWLLIINLVGLYANNRFNLAPDTAYKWINPEYTHQVQSWNINKLHNRWDSYWYLDIANNGYKYTGPEELSNSVFFPLYPLLINLTGSGWLVSVLATYLTVVGLYKLVAKYHPEADPQLAVFLLLIFPTAIFLNSIYTESLFLALSVWTIYMVRSKNYFWAGVLGMLACLTRVTGVLLLVPVAMEYFKDRKIDFKALYLLMIPLGLVAFFAYHYFKFGDFWLFFKIEKLWGRGIGFDINNYYFGTPAAVSNLIMDAGFLVFGVLAGIKQRASYRLYMWLTIGMAISGGNLMSIGRYILPLFPIYIWGASIKNRIVHDIWIMVSTMLMALYTMQFVNHYWAS